MNDPMSEVLQKIVDILSVHVVDAKFTGEVQLHCSQGRVLKAKKIVKQKKPSGATLFECYPIEIK